jgi:hypothetical protein
MIRPARRGAMPLSEVTLALFSLFNVLRLGSYVPQIIRVANDAGGAQAISYTTWCVWIGANGSTAAYAIVNLSDLKLFAISLVNTLCCIVVVGLTMWRRRQLAQRAG